MWEPEPNTHLYVERGTGYIKNPYIKGTLMQIWKSTCMFVFIWKYCPENLVFLILGILELHTRKICEMFVLETIECVKNYPTF